MPFVSFLRSSSQQRTVHYIRSRRTTKHRPAKQLLSVINGSDKSSVFFFFLFFFYSFETDQRTCETNQPVNYSLNVTFGLEVNFSLFLTGRGASSCRGSLGATERVNSSSRSSRRPVGRQIHPEPSAGSIACARTVIYLLKNSISSLYR